MLRNIFQNLKLKTNYKGWVDASQLAIQLRQDVIYDNKTSANPSDVMGCTLQFNTSATTAIGRLGAWAGCLGYVTHTYLLTLTTTYLAPNMVTAIADGESLLWNGTSWGSTTYTEITHDTTIDVSTAKTLYVSSTIALSLNTLMLSKLIKVLSTVSYTIVIPVGVTLYYDGLEYTNQTITVPSGYITQLEQVSAFVWFIHTNATIK